LRYRRFVVSGDSSGANLALGAAIRLCDGRPSPALAGLLLFYGVYSASTDGPSWHKLGDGRYGLSVGTMNWIWANYLPDQLRTPFWRLDPRIAPIHGNQHGLPPVQLLVGDLDPLLSDTCLLSNRLRSANVEVRMEILPGLTHGFVRYARLARPPSSAVGSTGALLPWAGIRTMLTAH